MALFFEHESIQRALVSVGLITANERCDSPFDTRPVFFGWTSKDLVLLQPANALLSLPESDFVRLPQPSAVVQEHLKLSRQPIADTQELKRLQTPIGQWLWAVAEFPKISDPKAAQIAASELQRFAGKHWPGWYDAILSQLVLDTHKGTQPAPILTLLIENAHRVAALCAVKPLTDWVSIKSKSVHVHLLEDVVAYSKQGLLDAQKIREVGMALDWIKLLADDCAETAMALVNNTFEPGPWRELQELVQSVTQAVSALNSLDYFSHDGNLDQTQIAVDQLRKGLTGIVYLERTVKESLAYQTRQTAK